MWDCLWKKVRSSVTKALEEERKKKLIKSSLEAEVTLHVSTDHSDAQLLLELLRLEKDETSTVRGGGSADEEEGRYDYELLRDYLVVASVQVVETQQALSQTGDTPWLKVEVRHSEGGKCERCWRWFSGLNNNTLTSDSTSEAALCSRCNSAVKAKAM